MAAMDRTIDRTLLIIGAGQAGATAAACLRSFGCEGRIVLVGAEAGRPYERPPLSKGVLSGDVALDAIGVHPAGFYEEQRIERLTGLAVTDLDVAARQARLADGRRIGYDQCLIATGGRARSLPPLPAGTPRVHYLRSAQDAARLREDLLRHRSLLIVGGGFLGLELASTARGMGLEVRVLESAPRLLARAVPPVFSQWLHQRVRDAGVDLHLEAVVSDLHADGHGVTAELAGHGPLRADLVAVAAGQEPDVDLARRAGICLHPGNHGIRTDGRCATSAPHVFAAGDCASQFHPYLGAELRLESWQSANEQARIAAAAMAGLSAPPLSAPWFWSDQFGCNLQMLGMPVPGLTYRCRRAADDGAQVPRFLLMGASDAGQILHAIAVNAGGDLRALKPLVDAAAACDPVALCDTGTPLRQQVRALLQTPTSANSPASHP